MNEQLTTVSTTANVLQAVLDVLTLVDKEAVAVPQDPQEVVYDVQAAMNRRLGKVV